MSKSKPKTIADLKINWTFDWNIDSSISTKIRGLNTEISSLKIVKNIYRFFIDDWHFAIETSNGHTLLDLIYSVDAKIFDLQQSNRLSRILVLDHFELIAENTFRIHVKN